MVEIKMLVQHDRTSTLLYGTLPIRCLLAEPPCERYETCSGDQHDTSILKVGGSSGSTTQCSGAVQQFTAVQAMH